MSEAYANRFEGEKYETNSTVNGREVVQSVFVRKIVPNTEMVCVVTQKYVFIVSKVNLNLVGSKTHITFSYEILITNVLFKILEPLYSRSVCKVIHENLYILSKYIESSVKTEDFKSQSRVWGMTPIVAIVFQYLLIVCLTVLFLQVKGRYFND